jgi:hypothetical protein
VGLVHVDPAGEGGGGGGLRGLGQAGPVPAAGIPSVQATRPAANRSLLSRSPFSRLHTLAPPPAPPQLLTSLSRPEAGRVKPILKELAQHHPQSVYYWTRVLIISSRWGLVFQGPKRPNHN